MALKLCHELLLLNSLEPLLFQETEMGNNENTAGDSNSFYWHIDTDRDVESSDLFEPMEERRPGSIFSTIFQYSTIPSSVLE